MLVFVLSLVLMLIVVSIMSIGVMMGRKPIAGSCGGLKTLGEGVTCEICGAEAGSCKTDDGAKSANNERSNDRTDAFYDAGSNSVHPASKQPD